MKYLLFLSLFWCSKVFSQPTISLACDIYPGPYSSEPKWLTYHEGALYFFAEDDFDPDFNFGDVYSLYKFDGACAVPVDLNENGTDLVDHPAKMASLGGKLYFSAYDGGSAGGELYVLDNNGVTLLADINPGPYSSKILDMASMNGKLYFSATDTAYPPLNNELWMYDPATQTTNMAAEVNPAVVGSFPDDFCVFNDKLYFAAKIQAYGYELWRYDPANGTADMISDINPGSASSMGSRPIVVNNRMYFTATEPVHGSELYVYDGINAPQRVTDLNPSGDGVSSELFYYNNAIYFSGDDGVTKTSYTSTMF